MNTINGNVTNTGTISVALDDLAINNGTLFNTVGGTLNVSTGRTVTISGGTSRFGTGTALIGAGVVDLTGTQILDIGSGYTHLATNTATLKFGGAVTVNGTGSFINQGTLYLRSADDVFNVAFDNATGSNLFIDGTSSYGHSTQTFTAGLNNAGTLTLSSDSISYNATLTMGTGKTLTNTGTITVGGNASGSDTINGSVINSGVINVNLDDLAINGTITSSGTITLSNGYTLSIPGGGNDLTLQAANILQGSGTLTISNTGGSEQNGVIQPGTASQAGILTINHTGSTLSFGSTSTINLDLGGTTVGSGYDKLAISGNIALDGTIQINVINSFIPTAGTSFVVMSYTVATGAIDHILGLNVGNGVVLDPTFSSTGMTLTARSVTHQGNTTDDNLTGTTGQDVMLGGDGNDSLTAEGTDLLFGETGDDVFVVNNTNFNMIDGGVGIDTLRVNTASIDLTTIAPYHLTNLEIIDLQAGTGANVLRLSQPYISEIINGGGALRIMGDASDTVHIGTGWSYTANATTIDGQVYNHYVQGDVSLLVDARIATSLDPVVLDLKGDGIELVDAAKGATFDMGLSGTPQPTGWVGAEDALLALDRNHNGKIDDATELFSERMFDGLHSGMEALARFDSNRDHLINSHDAIYKELMIWLDRNQDGFSNPDELSTLAQKGIVSLSLDTTPNGSWHGDNQVLSDGYYALGDETSGHLAEVALLYRPGEGARATSLLGRDEGDPVDEASTLSSGGLFDGFHPDREARENISFHTGGGITMAEVLQDFLPLETNLGLPASYFPTGSDSFHAVNLDAEPWDFLGPVDSQTKLMAFRRNDDGVEGTPAAEQADDWGGEVTMVANFQDGLHQPHVF